MRDDHYEPNRVFGMPVDTGPHARQGEEPQRVMGIPIDWFGSVDPRLKSLKHPVQAFRRWKLRRRLGPYAPDDANAE
jgi:hypothetical protein